ncbi:MAG: tetraacyldisaccharide 4'-kinase [Gemmatimonadota bacterium]
MPMQTLDKLIEWPHGDAAARVLGASRRRRGPFAAIALAVLEVLYGFGVRIRNALFDFGLRRAQRAPVPVISIGNLVAGGAGKTPFTRWVVHELTQLGRKVAVLHGGYGSDEPALHRRWQPGAIVLEERDRVEAADAAFEQGADVIVLDDAFQHRRLARELDIVLVPVEAGSARLLPRGPMREPEGALWRADIVVITRKTASSEAASQLAARLRETYRKPVAVVALLPSDDVRVAGPVAVVAAIARPDLLIAQLQERGVAVAKVVAYPDHHNYTMRDAEHIQRVTNPLPIVTTEKDAIKLVTVIGPAKLSVLKQTLEFESGLDELKRMIEHVL